jgi:hypothetical protein
MKKSEPTYVNSDPVALGKQRIGTIRATNAEAMTPHGMLKAPRLQGPARNRLPTKKTRIKTGAVNATKS